MKNIAAGIGEVSKIFGVIIAVFGGIALMIWIPVYLTEHVGEWAGWAVFGVYMLVALLVAAYDLGREKRRGR